MIKKCSTCKSESINEISFHNTIIEKCSDCDFVRINPNIYANTFLYNLIYEKNIAGFRKHTSIDELTDEEVLKIGKFMKYFDLSAYKHVDVSNCSCNVCGTELHEFKNKYLTSFRIFYCHYCNSLYFHKDSFDKFFESISEKVKKGSLIERLKRFFLKEK